MCVRLAGTDCDEAGDYVVPNVLSPRDPVSRPDNMNETVLHTTTESKELRLLSNRQFVSNIVRQSHFYAYIVACRVFPLCLVLCLNGLNCGKPKSFYVPISDRMITADRGIPIWLRQIMTKNVMS